MASFNPVSLLLILLATVSALPPSRFCTAARLGRGGRLAQSVDQINKSPGELGGHQRKAAFGRGRTTSGAVSVAQAATFFVGVPPAALGTHIY